MQPSYSVVLLAAARVFASHETPDAGDIGPAAFLWPRERPLIADADASPPCGSTNGLHTRTDFPMTNGRLALVARNKTRAVHVAVSYTDNPVSQDAFDVFDGPQQVQLGIGHTCIWAPATPPGVTIGSNATFQVFYTTGADVHFACADITYVESGAFNEPVPCFNASSTRPRGLNVRTIIVSPTAFPNNSPPWAEKDTRYAFISPGSITAVTMGSIVAAVLIALSLVSLWRRNKNGRAESTDMQEVEKGDSDSYSH
ncbi:hypothetical protein CERZMDRAFT_94149 [Cercospora zeae-maydis SCOH1-5]|uniref:Copper acquisition factor BIM1-like domain-containing protein n=1 Tax=Cercospora zeae-maydis SCOH1-5 TaxID=717836 RepID=A0A6A6FQK5_9PEZI|nr:hypothetical protein CERZMDRAFT_94149 [Cercospora zeae-maydis SCOH1-5]